MALRMLCLLEMFEAEQYKVRDQSVDKGVR
jgi:hypothetical protein